MNSIFESAVRKLTFWYVGALFVVCLGFSIPTYIITSKHLASSAKQQTNIIREVGPFGIQLSPSIDVLRDQQVDRDRHELLRAIITANLAVLALGAYFSYLFAKRTLKPLEEAHDAQTRFTTDASHELRTPLATMQTEIEVALRDQKFDTKQAKSVLGSNLEEIARLRNLSDQLLNLARLDSGQLQKAKVPLSKLVKEEISSLQKHHPKTDIDQAIEDKLEVQGDARLLRQLITILTDNALKYAGDKSPKLQIGLKKRDGGVLLTVTDHGIGIKASEIPHIFDRFYRGTSATKHSTNGHGLGLAIAKQIVDVHAGTIRATSQPGKQTTFQVSLPLSGS